MMKIIQVFINEFIIVNCKFDDEIAKFKHHLHSLHSLHSFSLFYELFKVNVN